MWRILSLAVLMHLGCSSIALGQISALAQLYGEGAHRYFAKDFMGAEQVLTRAIEAGSQDPRVFYFRGLARSAYGADGAVDFEQGARYEASGRVGANVGMALTRIQGSQRTQIEKARQDARLLAQQQRDRTQRELPATPSPSVPQTLPEPEETDPFTRDGLRSEEVDVVPAPSATGEQPDDTAVDPFGDESTPTVDDPFGDQPTPSSDDPFGIPDDEMIDPFSDSDTPAEVDGDNSDPFGG